MTALLNPCTSPSAVLTCEVLTMGLRWEAKSLPRAYKVFIHFVDPSGKLQFQGDHYPAVPTDMWDGPQEYVHTVKLPLNKPNGTYKILVGLSDPGVGRVELTCGPGVTDEGQRRYCVGTVVVAGVEDSDPKPVVYLRDFAGREQQAFDAIVGGGTVFCHPGLYMHSDQLFVRGEGMSVKGYGARLYATNPAKGALTVVDANDVWIKGLQVDSAPSPRLSSDKSCGILVYSSKNVNIEHNEVIGSAGAGIHISKGTADFMIHNNVVRGTMADGIHMTDNCSEGLVTENVLSDTGDDAIAMVGYVKNGRRVMDIHVADNIILNTKWGRGITVEGAESVFVGGNKINATSAAGILVASSSAYNSYACADITIADNELHGCNTEWTVAHGGIYLDGRTGFVNSSIFVENNVVADTIYGSAHIRVNEFNEGVRVIENAIFDADLSTKPLRILSEEAEVKGNTLNGEEI